MNRIQKLFSYMLKILTVLVVGLYLGNAAWIVSSQENQRKLLAHRGLHQTYNPWGVNTMDCTASIIDTPVHSFLENTIPSIQAAIEYGADIVEIDIHPTIDGEFMVFHDWELSCRTDGSGVVREQTKAYLKSLDIGFGYTSDGGKTYPFRGLYIGGMPTLEEVFKAFPKTHLLINIKGDKQEEAWLLTEYLNNLDDFDRNFISVYGSGANIPLFAELNPDIVTLHTQTATSCLKKYILMGWSGYMPSECANSFIPVPLNYRWLIWGWPNRFENRLAKVGSLPMLIGNHEKGKANSGIDDVDSIPATYGGLIFTNRIDILGSRNKSLIK